MPQAAETPVSTLVLRATQCVEELLRGLSELQGRLMPVLSYPVPQPSGAALDKAPGGDSPLEQALNEHLARLSIVIQAVADINARVRV
jgi:hypothetical protein